MTPEERAEAREWIVMHPFAEAGYLVKALDALEQAERVRDDAIEKTKRVINELANCESCLMAEAPCIRHLPKWGGDLLARAEQAERELAEERACHDCQEYREMMAAKLRKAERERDELREQNDWLIEVVEEELD